MKNDDDDRLLDQAVKKYETHLYTASNPMKAKEACYVYMIYREYEVRITVQSSEGANLLNKVFLELVKTGVNSFGEIAEKLKIDDAEPLSGRKNFMQLMGKHFKHLRQKGFISDADPIELTDQGKKFLTGEKQREVKKPKSIVFCWNNLTQQIEDMYYKELKNSKIRFEEREKSNLKKLEENDDREDHGAILELAQDYFHEKLGKKNKTQWIDYRDGYKHREQLRKSVLIQFENESDSKKTKELIFYIDNDQKDVLETPVEIKEDRDLIEKYGRKSR